MWEINATKCSKVTEHRRRKYRGNRYLVLDSSGLADNVAESGEDSEDEWNYYRVDPKQKENVAPVETTEKQVQVQVSEQESDIDKDEMSQLNPDAKEFVPVSPTRSAVSPTYSVVDDLLIAQSPRRAVAMDISVPSPGDFQCEVKQRPSELFDEFHKAHDTQNGHQLSSQEIMQNLLNGKDVNDIEFRPSNYTKSPADNYQFENKYNYEDKTKVSNENSESGVIPNESSTTASSLASPLQPDAIDFAKCDFVPKPQDPMSMSFYQDKDEDLSTNPFDLNKVQQLPENFDDIQNIGSKEDLAELKESISNSVSQDLSEVSDKLVEEVVTQLEKAVESPVPISSDNEPEKFDAGSEKAFSPEISHELCAENNAIEACDMLHSKSNAHVTFSPAQSPVGEIDFCGLGKPLQKDLFGSKSPLQTDPLLSDSPIQNDICASKSPQNDICELSKSPLQVDISESKSPFLGVNSPLELSSPVGPLSPKSPIPELTGLVSPDITASIKDVDENVSGEVEDLAKSPTLNQKTPVEDMLSSPAQFDDLNQAKSPLLTSENEVERVESQPLNVEAASEKSVSPAPEFAKETNDALSDLVKESSNIVQEISNEAEEAICEMTQDASSVQQLISDAIQDVVNQETPKSPSMFDDIISNVTEAASNMVDNITDFISEAKSDVVQAFEKVASPDLSEASKASDVIGEEIEKAATPLVDEVSEAKKETENVIQDFADNINQQIQTAEDHISNLAEQIEIVKEDIASPIETKIVADVHEINDAVSDMHDEIQYQISESPIKLEATITNEFIEPIQEIVKEVSESVASSVFNTSNVESEAPSEINAFLERSEVPEVTSPLSPVNDVECKLELSEPRLCVYPESMLGNRQVEIKCDTITPEFAVHSIVSPSEESKGFDTPPPTPAVVTEELQRGSPEPQQIAEAVEKLNETPIVSATVEGLLEAPVEVPVETLVEAPVEAAEKKDEVLVGAGAVAAAAAVTAAAATATKTAAKPRTATSSAAKKSTTNRSTPSSPTKPLASKTSTVTLRKTTSATSTTAPKVGAKPLSTLKPKTPTLTPSPKTAAAAKPAPKPRTATTPTAKPSAGVADKKPLSNGDAKVPARQPVSKKPPAAATPAAATRPATATGAAVPRPATATGAAATRPATARPATATATARPATATTTATATATATRPAATTTAPKPRPTTLTSKTTITTTSTTRNVVSKTSSISATKTTSSTVPKPRPGSTLAPRPRPATTTTRAAKAPDTEKQIKETANKQLSASRNTSTATRNSTTTTRTAATTLKKVDLKVPGTRTTTTRMSTTTVKSSPVGKKPTEVTKTTITKANKSNAITKPAVKQNGVVNVIQEMVTMVTEEEPQVEPHLLKDKSPLESEPPIIDNSQLPEVAMTVD